MEYRFVLFIGFLALSNCYASFLKEIDSWNVSFNGSTYTADGVTGIYTIAKQAGLIGDNLYYKYTDSAAKALALETWVFSQVIQWDDSANFNNVRLVLEGVDQISTVKLNDVELGQTTNMYVRYSYDIKDQLQAGDNTLEITINSPLVEANETAKKYSYPFYPECPSAEYKGDCHVNLIRKMPASFSWDWGPSVPSIGIWKPAYVWASDDSIIEDVVADVESANETFWKLNMDVYFSENAENNVKGQLDVKLSSFVNDIVQLDVGLDENNELVFSKSYYIDKSLTELWWPNGLGEQTTYTLDVAYVGPSGEISAKTVEVGFRTVELVQEDITNGLTFYFKINDKPVFIKGSNLIPVDLRPEIGQDKNLVKKVLMNAKNANMNMIRIWGGGVYESDYLYQLADELGIMIWQDFMFACALYPSDQDFLSNVVQEVRHQVKRLYSHPSVALFSGNNENEGLLMDNWYSIQDRTVYKEDYVKLYVDTIKTEFNRLTHNRGIYITSSPTNGKQSEVEGYLSTTPGSSYYGDVHYYNYNSDPFDPETYPIPRFCSEYGFQSLPAVESWLQDTDDVNDLNIYSEFMNYRQHHPDGNGQMVNLININLELPDQSIENYNEAFIYYSQIVQAYAYKIETERYRNYRTVQLDDGRGHTMGALYWQLNDVWVAPTWASVDYYNRWKMAHYFAREFFAPVIVTGHLRNSQSLDIFLITDNEDLTVAVSLEVRKWDALDDLSLKQEIFDVTLDAGSSVIVSTIDSVSSYLSEAGCSSANECYLTLEVLNQAQEVIAENFVLPAKLKESTLPKATVQVVSIEKSSDSEEVYTITLQTDAPALFVWLDTHGIDGLFSRNGFLLNTASSTVEFSSEHSTSIDELKEKLTVVHLRDQRYFPN